MPAVYKCPLGVWLIEVPPRIRWFDFQDKMREYFGKEWLINQMGSNLLYMRFRKIAS